MSVVASGFPRDVAKFKLTDSQRDLAERNLPLRFAFLNSRQFAPYVRALGMRDAEQEAAIGIMVAAKNWRPERGAFSTLAWRTVLTQLKRACLYRAGFSKPNVGFYVHLSGGDSLRYEPDHRRGSADATDAALDVQTILDSLRPRDRMLFRMRLSGMTLQSIARKLKISKQCVDQLLWHARRRVIHSFQQARAA